MGCCGLRRSRLPAVLAASPRPAPEAAGHRFAEATAGGRGVALRYRERSRILVRGPVTGRAYEFSPQQPTPFVDLRDADVLMRTGRFLRA
jgi:hypothetical protein